VREPAIEIEEISGSRPRYEHARDDPRSRGACAALLTPYSSLTMPLLQHVQFLIDKNGVPYGRYSPQTEPKDLEVEIIKVLYSSNTTPK